MNQRSPKSIPEPKPKPIGKTIMLQGTASDVGKSILTTALCRIFVQDGIRTAPFKSQNMSLNSYVTPDGKEIGRAQGLQADACRIAATTDMNPILLKPVKDMTAQVVVHGRPLRNYEARAYREEYLEEAGGIVREALGRLRETYSLVVIEGAGSPAEINLKDRDIVNMRLAGWADAPVILVADIDRGGVFASIVGTLELLEPHERDRIKGFVINKFRGDVSLLKPGLDWLEARTGKPVLGVIPYLPRLGLEDEDSASLDAKREQSRRKPPGTNALQSPGANAQQPPDPAAPEALAPKLDIAVLRLPRLSNFTDFDPLDEEPDVELRYVEHPEEWGRPDAVILPGSKNTMDDLAFIRANGLADKLLAHRAAGGAVLGICAGYQMMGRRLLDPGHVESDRDEAEGLGFFPIETLFTSMKKTVRVEGEGGLFARERLHPIEGYEIHMGESRFLEPVAHPFRVSESVVSMERAEPHAEGALSEDGLVWGTYIHGILHNDALRRSWLNRLRERKGWPRSEQLLQFGKRRDEAIDRLAQHVRRHLDMERIYAMIEEK
ncbi:cobyric acid synthase [Paenibacillus sp. YN15]|uniref:cobyric acid synthase n=1 Tax=Paenibacillus sp. YN15 TaxID=1742774 RepID=UPI000DCAEE97|nr:cobyric acid synthase [Paenibacillus sp. YN15]RAU97612.1 cobyric acid synthase CobQ [Paenibacillus sp. YN15]